MLFHMIFVLQNSSPINMWIHRLTKHQMTAIEAVVLNDEIVKGNDKSYFYPKSVPLMSSNEKNIHEENIHILSV